MTIAEAIEGKKRNYAEEKDILMKFSKILKSYISAQDIQKKLDENGFNGVYLLDEDLFSLIKKPLGTIGLYNQKEKVIAFDEKKYNMDKSIGIHEMGHAFLDSENKRKITIDENEITYGRGLEEGAMSLLACTSNIKNINKRSKDTYPLQSKLFQQLNVLYNYSSINEYENLLIHLFMEPKIFLSLIRDIYEDIYQSNFQKFETKLAEKSAFAMVAGTDILLDEDDKELYNMLNYLNALYLNVADKKIRNGEKNNQLFVTSKVFAKTREEILFSQLFGSDLCYMERQEQNLDIALRYITEILENSDSKKFDDGRSKIILPR